MAGRIVVNDFATDSPGAVHDALVGVRITGSADIVFCRCDVACEIGAWVLVGDDGRHLVGRVVIAADRWTGTPLEPGLRIVRQLTIDELIEQSTDEIGVPVIASSGPEFGSTGRIPSSNGFHAVPTTGALSTEDDRFRRAKETLPVPGQTVSTRRGDGKVIAIDVVRRSVISVVASDGSEIVESADDLERNSSTAIT